MKSNIRIEKFGERTICIGGIGTLFQQEGFPLGMSAKRLADEGVELSWFHVAKELFDNFTGRPERLFGKLESEIQDASVEGIRGDIEQLKKFIYAEYEDQQEMIFQYLFGFSSNEAILDKSKRNQLTPFVFSQIIKCQLPKAV